MRRYGLLLVAFAFTASPALAQEDVGALMDRLDRLERDVSFVQKQVYRGEGASEGASSAPLPANAGQLQVRFAQIDEEMRRIRGQIEQVQFQNKQVAADVKRIADDVDYRLRAIEQKQAAAIAEPAPAVATAAVETADEPDTAATEKTESAAEKPATYKPEPKEKPALTGNDFPNANAHYSHAFKLLNEKKFTEASTSFDAFVKKYPSDPLTSNAYYWLGESQFARKDYTRATESFRKGFEAAPDGQKAPDNLYKLAMSLAQIKRNNEACIVLSQVASKYSESAARTAARATEARTTLKCK